MAAVVFCGRILKEKPGNFITIHTTSTHIGKPTRVWRRVATVHALTLKRLSHVHAIKTKTRATRARLARLFLGVLILSSAIEIAEYTSLTDF